MGMTGINNRPLGQSGKRLATIGDTKVEVWSMNGDVITTAAFPVPGEGWAAVQIGKEDGSRWDVGLPADADRKLIGGWMAVQFPTIQDAVSAALSPAARQQMRAHSAHWRKVWDLEAQARRLRESPPAIPDGALVDVWS